MKTLSIVIPTYNVEKYLERCLDTLVFDEKIQKDIELIIVNDGSKDNSLKIARQYEKKYKDSIVVIDKENGGHGSTINAGLKVATGKYFRVIDSDDWVNIDDFSKYVNDLKKLDEDIVLTNYSRELLYTGESIKFKYKNLEYNKKYDLNKFNYSLLGLDYFFMATSTFKTEKLRKSGLILDEKTFYVDMEFILLPFLEMEDMIYLNYDIYRYFIGRPDQSINIQSYVRNRSHHEKVLKRLLEFYLNIPKSNKRKNYIFEIISQMLNSHYIIYCKAKLNSKKDINEIRIFDKYLKSNYPEFYNDIRLKHRFIKWNQKTNFIFSQCNNNLLSKLADKIENRVSRRNEQYEK